MKKSDIKKMLEQFKKTQDIDSIVERGNIEEQALLHSAGEDRPEEAGHAYDIILENENFSRRKKAEKEQKKKEKPKKAKGKVSARKR
jgi:hypothetical protein